MKTTTIVIGVVGLAAVAGVVYAITRPKKVVVGPAGAGAAFGTAIATYIPQAAGALFNYFTKPDTSSSSSTAVSNYLADVTAKSDSESGVVGFGGWD